MLSGAFAIRTARDIGRTPKPWWVEFVDQLEKYIHQTAQVLESDGGSDNTP